MAELAAYNKKAILDLLEKIAKKETYYHFKELIEALGGKVTDIQILKSELQPYYKTFHRNIKGRLIRTTFIELEGIKKYLTIGTAQNIEIAAEYFGFDIDLIVRENALFQLEFLKEPGKPKYNTQKLLRYLFDKRKACCLLPMEIELDVFYNWITEVQELNGDYPNSQKLETIRRAIR